MLALPLVSSFDPQAHPEAEKQAKAEEKKTKLFKAPRHLAASELWAKDNKAYIKDNVDSGVEIGVGGHFASVRSQLFKGVEEDVRDHYEKLSNAPPPDVEIEKAMQKCISSQMFVYGVH